MVKRVIVHDDVTNTCSQAELTAYPGVAAGANITVTPTTNATTGKITYTVAATPAAVDGTLNSATVNTTSNVLSLGLSVGGPITVDLSHLDSCECPPATGVIAPTVAPVALASKYYVNTATSPDTLYWHDGTAWNLIGTPSVAATETVSGIVELATLAEVAAGTDTTRAVTAAGVAAEINKIDPCTATAASAAEIAAMNGSELLSACIGGNPRGVSLCTLMRGITVTATKFGG
jgi:hypothetical protein